MDLDELELEIVRLLSENARLSYREIAKRLAISHANVSKRIKRLEQHDVIRGYTVVLNVELFDPYALCLQISIRPGFSVKDIGEEISDFKEISMLSRISGVSDLLVLAMCNTKQEATRLISDISMIEGISKVESHVVLEFLKILPKWDVKTKR